MTDSLKILQPEPTPLFQPDLDILIVGGGLWGQLLLHFCQTYFPNYQILLIEEKNELPSQQNWSCHDSDIPESLQKWFQNLVTMKWSQQSVQFPTFQRTLKLAYMTITAKSLSQKTMSQFPKNIKLGTSWHHLQQELDTDKIPFIFDTCGACGNSVTNKTYTATQKANNQGYQKFVGLMLKTTDPHGIQNPIIMDTTIDQQNMFRFFYTLPFSKQHIFIEDTRYSLNPDINIHAYKNEILQYAKNKLNLINAEVEDVEIGCLPIPLNLDSHPDFIKKNIYSIGTWAGLYQPVTGYSLPYAIEFLKILLQTQFNKENLNNVYSFWYKKQFHNHQRFFYLNRLLFKATDPGKEYLCFARFYRFNEQRISRFYNGSFHLLDWATMFVGRPPVSIIKALQVTFSLTPRKVSL